MTELKICGRECPAYYIVYVDAYCAKHKATVFEGNRCIDLPETEE